MRRWVLVVPFMFFACSGSQQPTATVAVSSPVPDPDPASAPPPPVDAGSIDTPPPVGDVPDAGMPADPPPQKSCMAAQGGSDSDLLGKTKLPMVSYYELLQTSGVAEGKPEVAALTNGTLLKRYFDDWRFVLQQIGQGPALLHIEPDLWGYAQQANSNPHALPAAVASANPVDCSAQENSVAGFAKCLIAMVRKYAPHAKVGLHASAWASGIDGTSNSNPSVDMAAEARKVADYLLALGGGDGDFVVVEASDRDAGWYQAQGAGNAFWDPANTTLPTFHQAFSWVTALTERMNKPALWWQLPLGNMSLPNVNLQWQDNRVDYFFTHTDEVARTNAFAMVFGAGEDHQTNPSTDNGNFVKRVLALTAAGGQPVCP
ncbi:MAG: hypothetical protein LC689_07940 [Myxococcales bacterium]|nr:hypothetical protein [Myxococcales bacterium]